MKKYMIMKTSYDVDPTIKVVNVDRETAKTVWVDDIATRKVSTWENYFDTFEEAKSKLIEWQRKRIKDLESSRDRACRRLETVESLGE